MNTLIENKLVEILDLAEKGVLWTGDQLPDLAKEIVQYGIWFNAIGLTISLIVLVLSLVGIGAGIYLENQSRYASRLYCTLTILGMVFGVITLIYLIGSDCVPNLIMALITPKLYLLEQLKGLLV